MEIRVLGISGSPIPGGNVETFMQQMLQGVSRQGVVTEALHLSQLEVQDCVHCNFCLRKQEPGKYCSRKDDGQMIFEKIESADVLLLATPVYFMRTSARMASLIDRLRVFVFGNQVGGKLKNKIGVSAAVAWARNAGFETTHLTHILAFMTLEMLPVSVHHCVSPLGASAVASPGGTGLFDKSIRLGVEHDDLGRHSAQAMMNRAAELAMLIRQGSAR